MKVSIDGARRNLAGAFNKLVRTQRRGECTKEAMGDLGTIVGLLLCVYDDSVKDDFSDLSEVVRLEEVAP